MKRVGFPTQLSNICRDYLERWRELWGLVMTLRDPCQEHSDQARSMTRGVVGVQHVRLIRLLVDTQVALGQDQSRLVPWCECSAKIQQLLRVPSSFGLW